MMERVVPTIDGGRAHVDTHIDRDDDVYLDVNKHIRITLVCELQPGCRYAADSYPELGYATIVHLRHKRLLHFTYSRKELDALLPVVSGWRVCVCVCVCAHILPLSLSLSLSLETPARECHHHSPMTETPSSYYACSWTMHAS